MSPGAFWDFGSSGQDGTMQFPDFRSMDGRGCRPAQSIPVLPGMSQIRLGSFPQDFPFEFRVLWFNAKR